jgi:AcrR family transcriptional regulator
MEREGQLLPRKQPKQRRSRETVEAILDATARVLVAEGYDKASTNRIARVAGVSIGSLYQYFPSKESLMLALVERHCMQMLELLAACSETLRNEPVDVAIHTYVRAMLAAHAKEPELHQVLTTQALQVGCGYLKQMEEQACRIVRGYLEEHRDRIVPTDLDVAAFVLVTAVEAVTHRAVMERPEALRSRSLEDEICALVLRYLVGGERREEVASEPRLPARVA